MGEVDSAGSIAPPNTIYAKWGKRCFDILFSLIALLLLAPLHLLLALLVKLSSPGPVIFCQKAVGKGGRLFDYYKYRTMFFGSETNTHQQVIRQVVQLGEPVTHDSEGRPVFKILNDPRVTPVGRILRKFSLDEWPQFYNVLRGDMSVVGPRPPLPYEAELYDSYQRQRLLIRPGITGLAQVMGRHRARFEQVLQYDLDYVCRHDLPLDLKLMLKTIPALLKGA